MRCSDWSVDVCSSDLVTITDVLAEVAVLDREWRRHKWLADLYAELQALPVALFPALEKTISDLDAKFNQQDEEAAATTAATAAISPRKVERSRTEGRRGRKTC